MTVEELATALADKIAMLKEEAKGMEGVPIKEGRFHFMYKEDKKKKAENEERIQE